MSKLNQIVAVVNGKKTQATRTMTAIYKLLQKRSEFNGLSRTYTPLDEDGEHLPPERKVLRANVVNCLAEAQEAMTELIDIVATQDITNCDAVADIVIDGVCLVPGVPVTHLLFLEKRCEDLITLISHIPTLDIDEKWEFSVEANCYQSDPVRTSKTKKLPRAHVLYEATKEHPAQVEQYHEDVKVGEWQMIHFSTCIPAKERQILLTRARTLKEGIKCAREEANNIKVEKKEIAKPLLEYIFKSAD